MMQTLLGIAFGNTDETFDNETNAIDREQLQVFVFVLAKGIVFVLMRGNVFVLLRGIVNGDPVRGQCQMFPANIRRYFAFFISHVNIAMDTWVVVRLGSGVILIATNMYVVVLLMPSWFS